MNKKADFFINLPKKYKCIILIVSFILLSLVTLTIRNLLIPKEIIVESDSWEELKQQMLLDYQIDIPTDSELVYARYIYQQEGLFLSLFFKAPETSDCELSEAWKFGYSSYNPLCSEILPDINFKYICSFNDTRFPRHTFLSKSDPIDGYVYYFIQGYAPSKIIR